MRTFASLPLAAARSWLHQETEKVILEASLSMLFLTGAFNMFWRLGRELEPL